MSLPSAWCAKHPELIIPLQIPIAEGRWANPSKHLIPSEPQYDNINRVFAENLVGMVIGCFRRIWLGQVSCSIKPILTHDKWFAVGKIGPNATFNRIFVGLGWPWVGEIDGFLIRLICFHRIWYIASTLRLMNVLGNFHWILHWNQRRFHSGDRGHTSYETSPSFRVTSPFGS